MNTLFSVAWRPLANTFVQASGGMSATAEVFVLLLRVGKTITHQPCQGLFMV